MTFALLLAALGPAGAVAQEEHPQTTDVAQDAVAPSSQHEATENQIDIIHHIGNAHELELPLVGTIQLPRWEPIHIGGIAIDLSPTKHLVFMLAAALIVALTFILSARAVPSRASNRWCKVCCRRSQSTTSTRKSRCESASAQWNARVDLPTPPFSFAKAMTWPWGRRREQRSFSTTEGCSFRSRASKPVVSSFTAIPIAESSSVIRPLPRVYESALCDPVENLTD